MSLSPSSSIPVRSLLSKSIHRTEIRGRDYGSRPDGHVPPRRRHPQGWRDRGGIPQILRRSFPNRRQRRTVRKRTVAIDAETPCAWWICPPRRRNGFWAVRYENLPRGLAGRTHSDCTTCGICTPPLCSGRVRRCTWCRTVWGTPTLQSPSGSTPTSSTRAHPFRRWPSPRPSPGWTTRMTRMTRTAMRDITMACQARGEAPANRLCELPLLARVLANHRTEAGPAPRHTPSRALTCGNTRADGGTRTPNPLFTRQSGPDPPCAGIGLNRS